MPSKKTSESILRPGEVLVMRTCDVSLQSHGGFQWPASGDVTAPDFDPEAKCGHGLHGLLWGSGDGSLLSWLDDAKWLVVAVPEKSTIDLGGKVKFPAGRVVFVGDRRAVVDLVQAHAPNGIAVVGSTQTVGDYGTATVGDYGTATAGDRGTATAGYGGTATVGDYGTATAGYRGNATAGGEGAATAGYGGTATAGYGGTATAGYQGTATAGYQGTATAGYQGTATAGDYGTATAGCRGTATAGCRGTATAGDAGTATAGYGGILVLRRWDAKAKRHRVATFYVGEDGIKPNTAYRVDAEGKPFEVTK